MGPAKDIYFADAAVFWAGFYTVMFREDRSMSRDRIVTNARSLATAFGLDLNYFGRSKLHGRPFTFTKIRDSQQEHERDK